jgi:hypothetical protein
MDVRVRFVALPATIGMGRVVNMSATGAFMETTVPLRRLSVLFLEPAATPAPNGKLKRMAASVVRHDTRGVGLEWCDADVESTPGYARLSALATAAETHSVAVTAAAEPREEMAESEDSADSADSAVSAATWGYEFKFLD